MEHSIVSTEKCSNNKFQYKKKKVDKISGIQQLYRQEPQG